MDQPDIVSWFDAHWLDAFTRGAEQGFHSLRHRDQILALVGATFDHEIGAGRRVLYAGPVGAHTAELAEAFEAIGSRKAAKVIREFAAMFPGGVPSPDDEERERQIELLPDRAWKVLHKFGELFDEWAPGGERVLLTQLCEWHHAQSEQEGSAPAKRKSRPVKKSPKKERG